MPKPEIVAHRGGARLWPENSLTAFREVRSLAVDQVEMDVHLSADGEVAVIHDPTLNRTTVGQGPVSAKTRAELEKVALIGSPGEGVPFLDQVLPLYEGTAFRLQIEIKVDAAGRRYPGIEEKVIALLRRHDVGARVQLGAFEPPTLATLRDMASDWPLTGFIAAKSAERAGGIRPMLKIMTDAGAKTVGFQHTIVSDEVIRMVRGMGLSVGVWTVNEPERLSHWVRQPIDFITTDSPDLALKARG